MKKANETINQIKKLCYDALEIDTHGLFIWLIELYKTQTESEDIRSKYDVMIGYLKNKYVDIRLCPENLAELWWGIGSREMFQIDVYDLHNIYYNQILNKISLLFYNELTLVNQSPKYLHNIEMVLADIYKIFSLPAGYRNAEKSTFYQLSPTYKKFLLERESKKEDVSKLIESLQKTIELTV